MSKLPPKDIYPSWRANEVGKRVDRVVRVIVYATLALVMVFTFSVALSGCATTAQLGPDTYMASDALPDWQSQDNVLKKAAKHCASMGKVMLADNLQFSKVIYRCLDADDPAYVRPTYTNTPDIVIEDRR